MKKQVQQFIKSLGFSSSYSGRTTEEQSGPTLYIKSSDDLLEDDLLEVRQKIIAKFGMGLPFRLV